MRSRTACPWSARGRLEATAASVALLLAVRGIGADPGQPWWSSASLAVLSVLAGVMAPVARRGRYLFASALLFKVAATVWWLADGWRPVSQRWPSGWIELIQVKVIALLPPALGSVALHVKNGLRFVRREGVATLHEWAALVSALAMACTVAASLACDIHGRPLDNSTLIGWLSLTAALVTVAACLIDRSAEPAWPPRGGCASGAHAGLVIPPHPF